MNSLRSSKYFFMFGQCPYPMLLTPNNQNFLAVVANTSCKDL